MKIVGLVLWIVAFELISMTIGMMTQNNVDGWYATLKAPPFTPPNIAFPIMWTILYAMIAAAGWYIWRHRDNRLLSVFMLYMLLNWSWSFVFFGMQQLFAGFLWILAINVLSLALVVMSWKRLRIAALLMIPPTLWTLFAAYLNGGYWYLN